MLLTNAIANTWEPQTVPAPRRHLRLVEDAPTIRVAENLCLSGAPLAVDISYDDGVCVLLATDEIEEKLPRTESRQPGLIPWWFWIALFVFLVCTLFA